MNTSMKNLRIIQILRPRCYHASPGRWGASFEGRGGVAKDHDPAEPAARAHAQHLEPAGALGAAARLRRTLVRASSNRRILTSRAVHCSGVSLPA